jgi:hypothetical protein
LTVTLIVYFFLLMLNAYVAPVLAPKGTVIVTAINVVVVLVLAIWLVGVLFGATWARTTPFAAAA